MASVDCTIHLLALEVGNDVKEVSRHLTKGSYIIKGRPRGWVHPPLQNNTAQLLANDWDLFLLTASTSDLAPEVTSAVWTHLSLPISIPQTQYDDLTSRIGQIPKPIPSTPPLPKQWPKEGGIPSSLISKEPRHRRPGELKLDNQMSAFLSKTLPADVRNAPVSLFNLFAYPSRNSSVHDAYMGGFKARFGPAAGAGVKFMGPVKGGVQFRGETGKGNREGEWQDANVVQYDSIWHYAYMLSTVVYQQLNARKVEGLVDTCILCVSEVELAE